ncbi:MAG: ATP-binding cassette domain-containing protein [Anaerolineae bacterium]
METKFLELQDTSKSFGKVSALDRVNFFIKGEPEIVALIGDNGAGKSTLIKIISGVHPPDSGEIHIQGEKVDHWSVAKARAAGIETVYQDRALVLQQTIARNIFMGRERTGVLGFVKGRSQLAEANRLMRTIGFTSKVFASDSVVAKLSGGERQGVAIARALYFQADLMILDEPTTALSLTESEKVFDFIRRAKESGTSCIFISHNIYHAYDVAERFVVLDRGKVVLETDRVHTTAEQLVKDMQEIARCNREGSA